MKNPITDGITIIKIKNKASIRTKYLVYNILVQINALFPLFLNKEVLYLYIR